VGGSGQTGAPTVSGTDYLSLSHAPAVRRPRSDGVFEAVKPPAAASNDTAPAARNASRRGAGDFRRQLLRQNARGRSTTWAIGASNGKRCSVSCQPAGRQQQQQQQPMRFASTEIASCNTTGRTPHVLGKRGAFFSTEPGHPASAPRLQTLQPPPPTTCPDGESSSIPATDLISLYQAMCKPLFTLPTTFGGQSMPV